jgi:hypothetical protein
VASISKRNKDLISQDLWKNWQAADCITEMKTLSKPENARENLMYLPLYGKCSTSYHL